MELFRLLISCLPDITPLQHRLVVSAVYRFYNTRDKAFFYTSNVDERDYVVLNSAPKYTSGTGGYLEETAPYHRYFSYTEGWRSQFYTDRQYDLDNNPDYIYEGIFQVPVKADDDVFKEIAGLLDNDESYPLFYPGQCWWRFKLAIHLSRFDF